MDKLSDVAKFDLFITQAVQQFRPFGFDQLMRVLSGLGNSFWAPLSVILFLLAALIVRRRYDAVMIGAAGLGSFIISQFLKQLVVRPRPDGSALDSFPSGHVVFFVGFYGFLLFLTYIHLKNKWYRNFFLVVYSLLMILGGLSRIYLGAHWFSDVLGGYLVGSVWLLLMIFLYQHLFVTRWFRRYKAEKLPGRL